MICVTRPRARGGDREARAQLVQEAMTTGQAIELQPCQRINGHLLRYPPLAPATLKPGPAALEEKGKTKH